MPRFPTFPTLYDEVLQIHLSKLKEWGYLKPNQYKSGTITWSRNGNTRASISIATNTKLENPYLELDYKCQNKPVNYKVPLVCIPSNLGKGAVWYFLCPHTGKRCRKLYSVGEKFLHREAFRGCMYEKQTYSHKNRVLFKTFEKALGNEKLYEQLYSRYFKTHYAGKPTKRYLRIMEKIRQSEQFSLEEIENLYLV